MFNLEEQSGEGCRDGGRAHGYRVNRYRRGLRRRRHDGRRRELANGTGGVSVVMRGALGLMENRGQPRTQPKRYEQARIAPQAEVHAKHGRK